MLLLLLLIIGHQTFHEGRDNADLREIAVLSGPSEPIYGLDYSPDGKTLVTLGLDESARHWEAASGRHVKAFTGHQSPASSVAFSGDGEILASAGSTNGEVIVWVDPGLRRCQRFRPALGNDDGAVNELTRPGG